MQTQRLKSIPKKKYFYNKTKRISDISQTSIASQICISKYTDSRAIYKIKDRALWGHTKYSHNSTRKLLMPELIKIT